MATRPLTALAGFVAALAAVSLNPANALELYTIEGYMDRAPSQAEAISRVEVSASKTRARYLLVTACRSSRATWVDLELAHATHMRGKSEEVSRLLAAPVGAAVKLTFAVYAQPVTSLQIVELGDHAA
jgi:protein involved in temperature-dependent protein secretion